MPISTIGTDGITSPLTLASPTFTTPNINSAQFATVSGTAPLYACRAWVNFNGTGTVAIRASGNVTSITDNGTGDYTLNFTTAMPDANYNIVTSSAGAGTGQLVGLDAAASPTQTTSSVRAVFGRSGASPFTILDPAYIAVSIFR